MYLAVRTDQPEASIILLGENEGQVIDSENWLAERQLSVQLLPKITKVMKRSNHELAELKGIIFFSGPGSFTGLRIGASVVNALAYSLNLVVVGSGGVAWIETGRQKIKTKPQKLITKLSYQAGPHITKPRK